MGVPEEEYDDEYGELKNPRKDYSYLESEIK